MMPPVKVLISWSSGKDAAWAFHLLQQAPAYEVVGLLTTLNEHFDRVAMHSTRRTLLEAQAASIGLPLWTVPLPWPCSNAIYESNMTKAFQDALEQGIGAIAFGDLFLEEVRCYREERLCGTGLQPLFPIWGFDTNELVHTMLEAGVRARIVCLDPQRLPACFAGRDLDPALLEQLPPGVDPCGENGEFHTFVHTAPFLRSPIPIQSGEVVHRDGFVFADVLPAASPA